MLLSIYLIHSTYSAENSAANLQLEIHSYSANYLALGFTWTGNPDCPSPLCIVCEERLTNSILALALPERNKKFC